jgi:hypothetical protein
MNIIGYNAAWQYPARTEYAAYIAARQLDDGNLKSFTYIGFPWATLIDSFQSSRINRWEILQTLTGCIDNSQLKGRVVTTCQHIYALNYIHLFEQFGVTDLFFPHKLNSHDLVNNIRIHPFPLFPVQASPPDFKSKDDREYLASFVGAYNSNVYLTDVREHIFRLEGKDPLIKIVKRDAWHYDRTVYDLQMQGGLGSLSEIEREKANEREYKNLLANSLFSLCPSGSGPNSIRLYESMTYGSIPVVLAKGLDLAYLHTELQDILVLNDDTSAGLQRALEQLQTTRKEETSTLSEKGRTLIQLRHTYEPMGYSAIITDALKAS